MSDESRSPDVDPYEAVVARCWEDEEFKTKLIADPRGTIEREMGLEVPQEVEIEVVEQTPAKFHLVLPEPPKGGDTVGYGRSWYGSPMSRWRRARVAPAWQDWGRVSLYSSRRRR